MENEINIKNILNKFEGINKTTPSSDLYKKIENKIIIQEKNTIILRYLITSIFVIISLNIIILLSNQINKNSEISSFDRIINKNNQIY